MKQLKLLLIIPLILFATATSVAQVTTSSIKGVVVDEGNQPFSGANVVAIHTPSGTKFGAITNFDGRYNILNMRVGGPYSVTISYLGYKSQTFDDVYLSLGKTNTIDVTMVEESEELEAVVISGTGGSLMGILFPRKSHRPACYYQTGEEMMLVSPGAVDVGGLVILPRQEDYNRMTRDRLLQIFNEVCCKEDIFDGFSF